MPSLVVVGAQWGDEGKGRIVDLLSMRADIVVRFQGGCNAGHTLVIDDHRLALHLIPAGIVHKHTLCIIGNGVVVDPQALLDEIETIRKLGIDVSPKRLLISDRAHVTFTYHRILDTARESAGSKFKLGTTQRGIGPTYVDKVERIGIRMIDLLDRERLRQKLEMNFEQKADILSRLPEEERPKIDELCERYLEYGEILAPFICDTTKILNDALRSGCNVLFEGAQGAGLDVDFGTFPFVTSSNTISGSVCTGAGVPPTLIDAVIGVSKVYTTRVGAGPFPTELKDEIGDKLREIGMEYGATTGRPRRCGWLDLVQLRFAARINGFDALVLTKLDVLDHFEEIKVCVAYKYKDELLTDFPASSEKLSECEPVYETLKGWLEPTKQIRNYDELPERTKQFVDYISQQLGVPIGLISVGPRCDDAIVLDERWLKYEFPTRGR